MADAQWRQLTADTRWPDGEGPPPGSCQRCGRKAWCWLRSRWSGHGFICESCATELGEWPPKGERALEGIQNPHGEVENDG